MTNAEEALHIVNRMESLSSALGVIKDLSNSDFPFSEDFENEAEHLKEVIDSLLMLEPDDEALDLLQRRSMIEPPERPESCNGKSGTGGDGAGA